jgi:adenylate kinase family enzyme
MINSPIKQRIHIFGANGSGTTTLGVALAKKLNCVHYDSHKYVRDLYKKHKNYFVVYSLLDQDLRKSSKWILSGWLFNKADSYKRFYDLAVFLWVPKEIRLARLKQREVNFHGKGILAQDNPKYKSYKKFLDWTEKYDTAGVEQLSRTLHEKWMANLTCPILRLEGDYSMADNVKTVLDYLN